MKRTQEYIKRNIAGETILVPAGETAGNFNGMITLTESGEFIWDHIEDTPNFGALVDLILETYDIDRETASQDASAFVMQLLQAGMVKPSGTDW